MNPTVEFSYNEPVQVALHFPQGKIIETRFGQRVMYSLNHPNQHVMFLDLDVSRRVTLLAVQPGETFWVCKRPKKGVKGGIWDLWLDPATEAKRAARPGPTAETGDRRSAPPRPDPPPAESTMLERQLAASIHEAQSRRPPQSAAAIAPPPATGTNGPQAMPRAAAPSLPASSAAPAWSAVLIAKADVLIDAYAACLEHASKHGNRVEPGDVRSLLQTVYIAMTKNGVSSNAA